MLDINKTICTSTLFGSSFADPSLFDHLNADDLSKNDLFTHSPFLDKKNFIVQLFEKYVRVNY